MSDAKSKKHELLEPKSLPKVFYEWSTLWDVFGDRIAWLSLGNATLKLSEILYWRISQKLIQATCSWILQKKNLFSKNISKTNFHKAHCQMNPILQKWKLRTRLERRQTLHPEENYWADKSVLWVLSTISYQWRLLVSSTRVRLWQS